MNTPEFSFSFMRPEDAEELSTLARRIWTAYYPTLITHAQIEYMLARNYNVETLRKNLSEGHKVLLLKQEGTIKGFMGIGDLAKMQHPLLRGETTGDGCYFLHRLYLAPELHGTGVGHRLFAETLKRVPQIKLMRLQVHRGNKLAHNFYKRQGFRIVAEHDFDLGNDFQMTDYVMEWAV